MELKAFFSIGYGMYIVSSFDNDKFNGQITNTVFQVTSDPPKMAVCINKKNLTHTMIEKSKVFSISVLEQDTPMIFIGLFGFKSGRNVDKFKNTNYKKGITGAPVILDNTLSYFECELTDSRDQGTHTMFIGIVKDAQVIKPGIPLTYSYYHEIKKGFSSENAPTYIKGAQQSSSSQTGGKDNG